MCEWIATMLMPASRNDFKAGRRSFSVTAKSPSTTAFSSLPAKAAQVFIPIVLSIVTPCLFVGRPKVNFIIPLFTSPLLRKILFNGSAVIVLMSGKAGFREGSAGAGGGGGETPALLLKKRGPGGRWTDPPSRSSGPRDNPWRARNQ